MIEKSGAASASGAAKLADSISFHGPFQQSRDRDLPVLFLWVPRHNRTRLGAFTEQRRGAVVAACNLDILYILAGCCGATGDKNASCESTRSLQLSAGNNNSGEHNRTIRKEGSQVILHSVFTSSYFQCTVQDAKVAQKDKTSSITDQPPSCPEALS